MAKIQEFYYPSSDGTHQIHAVEWRPDSATPRAVVQLVHGISEYVQRYDHFARFLTERGFIVTGNDHLGHGKTARSPKEYGCFPVENGWAHVLRDVRGLRQLQGEKYPALPYFMLGHSMGSFLTRNYLMAYPGTVTGAILSGTGQEPALTVAAGKLLAKLAGKKNGPDSRNAFLTSLSLGAYNKKFAPNRTGSDWISRDEKTVDAYGKDPLCHFVPSVGMFGAMMGGLQTIGKWSHLEKMCKDTPIYFFSGDQDPVGAQGKGVRTVFGAFQRAGVKDVTLKLYAGGRHEMLNEINRDEVYRDTVAWLERHL